LRWLDASDDSVIVDDAGIDTRIFRAIDSGHGGDACPAQSLAFVITPGAELTAKVEIIQVVSGSLTAVHLDARVVIQEMDPGLDYMTAVLSTPQFWGTIAQEHIQFDAMDRVGTSIELSTGTGQDLGIFTLQSGKTYKIEAHIAAVSNETARQTRWRDASDDSDLADDTGVLMEMRFADPDANHDITNAVSHVFVYTPVAEISIKLDMTTGGVSGGNWVAGSCVLIQEINPAIDYLIAALSATQTTNIAVNDHIEFDASDRVGTSIEMSTGSGQANGIFTIADSGKTYLVEFYDYAWVNEGYVFHQACGSDDNPVADDLGLAAPFTFMPDNRATDRSLANATAMVFTPSGSPVSFRFNTELLLNFVANMLGARVFITEL
jgi:hypothetical protein